MPNKDGETRRQVNVRFKKAELNPTVKIEPAYQYLWAWFWEIDSQRSSGLNGPNALRYSDITDWAIGTGNLIRPEEAQVIRRIDAAYLSALAEERA